MVLTTPISTQFFPVETVNQSILRNYVDFSFVDHSILCTILEPVKSRGLAYVASCTYVCVSARDRQVY